MDYLTRKFRLLVLLTLVLAVGIGGCDKESSPTNSSTSVVDATANMKGDTESLQQSSPEISDKTNQAARELLAFAEEHGYDLEAADKKMAALTSQTADSRFYQNMMKRAINGDKYECSSTPLNAWASENLQYANLSDALFIILNGVDQFPFLYSLIFESERNPRQEYGYNGEYSRQIVRVERSISRFWGINLRDVETVSGKGSMLADYDKVFELVEVLYPSYTEESNADFAQQIVDLVTEEPLYSNGDAPLFSFNAVAYNEGPIFEGGEVQPPKIIMGDGILAGMDAIGLGEAAPEAILAHEMAHQVQYELNVFEEDTISDPARSTRRTELMADALSAYYLGHKRGAAFNWGRVETFMQTDFNVGDCSFESESHHGTPQQRLDAAEFGFNLAENAPRRMGIMSPSEFIVAFDDKLPEIVAPDAEGG